jgi:hypothetical protein
MVRQGRRGAVSAVLALVVLAVLALSACGKDGGGKAATGPAPDDASTTAGSRSGANPGPRATGAAGSDLTRGLLRFEDMPAGWRLSAQSAGSPDDTELCGTSLATLEQHRGKLGEAAVGFERGESGPYVAQTLAAYPPGVAERVMTDLATAVQTCREVTVRDEEGSLSTWQLTPLSFPQFGDATVAFREYWPANGVEAIIVYLRRGDRIAALLHIAVNGRVDRIETETLVSRAYERFQQLNAGR